MMVSKAIYDILHPLLYNQKSDKQDVRECNPPILLELVVDPPPPPPSPPLSFLLAFLVGRKAGSPNIMYMLHNAMTVGCVL